jgi:hypothetical protein
VTGSRRAYSGLVAALFVSAFFLYGVGYGLVTSVTGAPDFLATISAHQTTLLFRTRLIPRFLSVWGLIGYAIFMTGAVAEICGVHIGLICSIPGGLFELAVGIWLISRASSPRLTARISDDRVALLRVIH